MFYWLLFLHVLFIALASCSLLRDKAKAGEQIGRLSEFHERVSINLTDSRLQRGRMFLKVQLPWNVIIPAENLDEKGLMLQKSIIVRLLGDFANKKATKELGYFLAVTTLESIGEGRVRLHTGDVLFPVVFNGISFKIFKGEVIEGVVHKVLKHGVLLRCGPIESIFLSDKKMPDYSFMPGDNPLFFNDKSPKIEKDAVVRATVIGTKWMEAEREFQALVSLEGDYLGPVA